MKNIYTIGDKKVYKKVVTPNDLAQFESGVVHEVCSTFALAQAIEWSSRLFVLDMKEADEEGIGTMLTVEHKSPAMVGNTIEIIAQVEEINGNELICNYTASVKNRIIATGKTGQKIVKKDKIKRLFDGLRNE